MKNKPVKNIFRKGERHRRPVERIHKNNTVVLIMSFIFFLQILKIKYEAVTQNRTE